MFSVFAISLEHLFNLFHIYYLIMILYTTKELATIITNCKSAHDIGDISDYVMLNAVAIINKYGASYYNAISFSIQEKIRIIFPVTV